MSPYNKRPMLRPLLRALRPVQWVKNTFVLAPVVFAHRLGQGEAFLDAGLAFAAFCFAASAVYLLNDLRDREEDRRHPLKRHRPIASGALPVSVAAAVMGGLAVAALALALTLGLAFTGLLAIYLAINLLYNSGLKRVVILDVMAVASGYVLRIQAGAEAVDVGVSNWLLLCTIFLALLLVLSKRRHELVLLEDAAADQRSVLDRYSPLFLDQMINVVTASAVVSFALYAVDPDTVTRFGTDRLVYTLPLVLFGVFRFLYLVYQTRDTRNPTEAILTDLPSLANLVLWGLAVLWIVYG